MPAANNRQSGSYDSSGYNFRVVRDPATIAKLWSRTTPQTYFLRGGPDVDAREREPERFSVSRRRFLGFCPSNFSNIHIVVLAQREGSAAHDVVRRAVRIVKIYALPE